MEWIVSKKTEIVLYRTKRSIKFWIGDLLVSLGVLKPAEARVVVRHDR